ncbi:tRNA 2-selenouridine(34) synthase MnmH [Rheinheimera maricola]|uniref:tRNA 2-selenouridine synthase n=1 Tax=Rheinheimera maricola TaxID=2793282 RepID=A0ABS7X5M7_9GAMM|nr:tRNA 2-selenouridine(34) synthase MnmH [Rheinheimera maricola]MBZ9610445.1 tRNA 2-selenouridine(34) synthase MnmH [Rheinheimera maricola]
MGRDLPLPDNYHQILQQQLPLLDLRAPLEFSRGAFANSCNWPLMTDAERAAVGTCYKQHGQQAAISLGHQLVQGEVKQRRVQSWVAFTKANPEGMLYCARGGLRSQIAQQWLADTGVVYPRVKGGFKALRQAAINVIAQAAAQPLLLLAGPTGSGKTRLLKQLQAVDLEGLANHRGSAFGRRLSAQPAQIRFENDLAAAILRVNAGQPPYLLLEDESLLIGQRNIPHPLYQAMQHSPLLLLEEPLPQRVEVILQDYIIDLHCEALSQSAEQGFSLFSDMLCHSMARISKRLGGVLYAELQQLLLQALAEQQRSGDVSLHRVWIERLLRQYYDPMYYYQLQKRNLAVLQRGDAPALQNWWRQHSALC